MAPIHETDVAEKRWSDAEWQHYELWEKLEIRARKRRRLWILATVLVFVGLSSVPVIVDSLPRWRALKVMRRLAEEVAHIKTEASLAQQAYLIRVRNGHDAASVVSYDASRVVSFEVRRGKDCKSASEKVRDGVIPAESDSERLHLLLPAEALQFGIPGVVEEFCYDPKVGSSLVPIQQMFAFGLLPAKDLAVRQDRVALVLLQGNSAEISLE